MMKAIIPMKDQSYELDLLAGKSIAISQTFDHNQPNHFSAKSANATPMRLGSFIGDTRQGGSCNVFELALNTHCNGTHTETIGHICHLDLASTTKVNELQLAPLLPAVLISVKPTLACDTHEKYAVPLAETDSVITKQQLAHVLNSYNNEQLECLVIRTLPNNQQKQQAQYNESTANYFFTTQAMHYLNSKAVKHLVVDMPSIDKLNDQGLLANHHLFWQVEPLSRTASSTANLTNTITELAYIENTLEDGFYFINLQLPAFNLDAAPSQPVLYPAKALHPSINLKE